MNDNDGSAGASGHEGSGGELDRREPYHGVENLEAMSAAENYNRFLVDAILGCSGETGVLDFGAGTGMFARALRGAGRRVTCVEPDPALRARLLADGFPCSDSLADLAPGSMRFAYTLNVLEHIAADDAAARALYEVLRPGGRLLVYVPAFNLLYSSMDRRVGHHRRYRRRTLVPLLEAAGFAIESARYCDSLGFLAALAFKAIGNREGAIAPASVSLYDRVAFPLSRVLDRVTQRFFGKNILVVARRPA